MNKSLATVAMLVLVASFSACKGADLSTPATPAPPEPQKLEIEAPAPAPTEGPAPAPEGTGE